MNYRDFTAEDGELFRNLDKAIFPDDPSININFEEILRTRKGYFLFTENLENPVGYVIIIRSGDNSGHLQRIGVAPDQRNKGFGKKLMELALVEFKKMGINGKITLYVEKENEIAFKLYKNTGFTVFSESWHFIAKWTAIGDKKPDYECLKVTDDHIEQLSELYSLEKYELEKFINYPDRVQLLLMYKKHGEIRGYCKFTPSFPGCRPFIINDISLFDTFVRCIEPYSLPKFDIIRFTFDDNQELASLMTKRGYDLHHSLYKMEYLPDIR